VSATLIKMQHSVDMFQRLTAFPPLAKGEGKHLLSLGCYKQWNVVRRNQINQCKGEVLVDVEFCLWTPLRRMGC